MKKEEIIQKASKIKLVITDSDGVLTDTGVYYSGEGEVMKRFSIRDGMGVERLRNIAGIETAIITGELSGSVIKRAEKLLITELHLGIKNKIEALHEICNKFKLNPEQVAYIGDDTNDLEVMNAAGLSACPGDAISFVRKIADYVCEEKGGHGAFRELAELIISSQKKN